MNVTEWFLLTFVISAAVYVGLTALAVRWGINAALDARDRRQAAGDRRKGLAPERPDPAR